MERLDLSRIAVRSFYGAPQTGLTVDLGPGLNVVVGPNGQGKTTLARALHGALWPETVREFRPSYDARFHVGDERWDVAVEAGEARYTRGGAATDRLALPDASYRSRYLLALSDLVVDDGQAFADAVRRDAAGGVDLSLARAALGYRAGAPRQLDAARKAQDAAADVRRARNAQAALRTEAEALPALVARAGAAAGAAERVALLDRVENRALAHAAAVEAARLADAYPAPMANVARDTAARYEALADETRRTAEALDRTRQAAAEASTDLRGHAWAGADAPSPTELAARVRALDEATRAVGDAERAGAAARAAADHAAAALRSGGVPDDVALAPNALAPDALARVADLAAEAGRTRAQADEMAARAQVLRAHHNRIQPHDADALRRGVDALRTWLAYSTGTDPVKPLLAPGPVWTVAGVLAVVALALGGLANPWALLLLLGSAGLAWVAFTLGQPPLTAENPSARARESYELLRLDRPAEWTAVHVEQTLALLDRQSAAQDVRRLWRERIDEVERSVSELEGGVAGVEAREMDLSAELGLRVPRGAEGLLVLAHQLVASDAAARAQAVAEGVLAQAVASRDTALAAVNALLAGVPLAPARDAAEAAAAVTTVAQGVSARDALRRASAVANAEVDGAAQAHRAAQDALDALLGPLGITGPDSAAVARLCAAFDEYHDARTAAARATALADEADRAARAHPLFDAAVAALSLSDVALRRDEARHVASGRDGYVEAAARTRERVDQARSSDALASAAARHGAALDALEADYDDTADAVVGDALAHFVEDDTRDEHLPRVFGRARDHLAAITADRYRLDFDADAGLFLAFDTSTERTLALDALSSGTRLQLLIAVRLAFAEVQEVGFRLPLLVDEALATSDDDRAASIIDAVLGLCRGADGASESGRQVVVFTSQAEEAARWVRAAGAPGGVACQVVALPGVPLAPASLDAAPAERTTRAVADPAGHTTATYARATNAAPWTAREPLAALPVALVLDPEAAHACLRAGFDTWGPLRAAMRRGASGSAGGTSVPLSEPEARRLLDRVAAVDAWQQAWLVGRGRPVDRAALAASGTAGPFLDALAEILDAARGDARALVRALRESPPDGFRRARVDDVEAFLTANGYLPSGAPLRDADLRASVAAATAPAALDDALATLARLRTYAESVMADATAGERARGASGDGHSSAADLLGVSEESSGQ